MGVKHTVPKGIVNNTAITTPVSCSLQHDIFHLGLGRPLAGYPLYTCYRLPRAPGYEST